jgi:ParB-like chromosome segregation protein Spo0J
MNNLQETEGSTYKDLSNSHPIVKEIIESRDENIDSKKFRDRVVKLTDIPEVEPKVYHSLIENGELDILTEYNPQYIYARVPLKETVASANIRPLDVYHAIGLGFSIKENTQLAPCIAHINEKEQIEVLAGDHRRRGLILATNWNHDLLVNLYLRTLSKQEQIEIQLTENKQNPMKPEERATVYHKLWRLFLENDGNISKAQIAARLNESPSVFYKAILYEERLNPQIQDMVDQGLITYSTALLFTRIEEKERQLKVFTRALSANLDNKKIREMINNIISQEDLGWGLWSPQEFEEMSAQGAEQNFKLKFHKEANEAIVYLCVVASLVQKKEVENYVPMTEAVARDMTRLIFTTMHFLNYLRNKFPENYEELQLLVAREIDKSADYFNPQKSLLSLLS